MSKEQKKKLTNKQKQEVKENVEQIKKGYKIGIKYYENVEDKTE